MIDPAFMFTIFFLTLGPLKTVPGFFLLAREMEPAAARAFAIKGALIATAICLLIALVLPAVAEKWKVSLDALMIAGGILLFAASFEMIGNFNRPPPPRPATPPRNPAATPLAIPTIVTPWGVVAILVFTGLAGDDAPKIGTVLGLLALIMALNLVGMLLARQIIGALGFATFQVVGWVFAVLQAGLAVEWIITALRNLGVLHAAT